MMLAILMALAAGAVGDAREIAVPPFHDIDLETGATVRVEPAARHHVSVEGDPRMVRCVTVEVREGTLVIDWASRASRHRKAAVDGDAILVDGRMPCGRPPAADKLTVNVQAPTIDGVTISERGEVEVGGIASPAFRASVPGSGRIALQDLKADRTRFTIGGSGVIVASGALGQLGVTIGGSGRIDTRAARASAIAVSIGGSGTVDATVDGPASGAIGGSGRIAIGGHPTCSFRKLGSGTITCPVG